jgi:hypothetical protein
LYGNTRWFVLLSAMGMIEETTTKAEGARVRMSSIKVASRVGALATSTLPLMSFVPIIKSTMFG